MRRPLALAVISLAAALAAGCGSGIHAGPASSAPAVSATAQVAGAASTQGCIELAVADHRIAAAIPPGAPTARITAALAGQGVAWSRLLQSADKAAQSGPRAGTAAQPDIARAALAVSRATRDAMNHQPGQAAALWPQAVTALHKAAADCAR